MHKNKPRANPTLINVLSWYMSSKWGPLGPIRVLALLESNFEVNLTFYLKKINCTSIPYENNNEIKFESMTYYSLYVDSPLTTVCNLTR